MQPKRRTATTTSLAAPIGGWNARDSLANMQPLDAVQLVNFFPTPTDVTLRKGYTKYSTDITGVVETLISYNASNPQKLFAFAEDKIYFADEGAASVVYSGLSDSRFQFVSISNNGGNFISAVNGLDQPLIYDGTIWYQLASTTTAQTISTITHVGAVATLTTSASHGLQTGNKVTISGATPSDYNGTYVITRLSATQFEYTMATTPASNATVVGSYSVTGITGVDPATFINVNLFKNRLYYTQKDTLNVYYLDVDAISGPASPILLGGVARNGGFVQAMGTWTLDAGEGVDDYAVFVTNMGEVIVYNGTNPSEASTWALKGVWQLGQTFNRRCFFKWSGDLLLLTQDGLVPLASALQSSRLDPRVNLTDKIFYSVSQAASQYYDNFGWQINYFASENMLILNVPTDYGTEQYVMHTITKSWARFTGIEARCFEVHDKAGIFFGSDGFVGQYYNGYDDAGSNITATAQQAYSYFNTPGQLKRFTLVRPILQTVNGTPTVLCNINVDFETQDALGQIAFNPSNAGLAQWDVAKWDQGIWGGALIVSKIWQGVSGIGFAGSININVASSGIELHWASTDYVMENGGVL